MRHVALAALAALAGCGPAEYTVRGRVTYPDGTPLARGQVVLESAALNLGTGGDIQPDGTFTTRPTAPGRYAVYLIGVGGGSAPDAPPPVVEAKFTRPETSGVTVEVGRQAALELTVGRP